MTKIEDILVNEFKEKIWGIGKIKADEKIIELLKLLYNYSSIEKLKSDEVLEKNKDKFEKSEHLVIFTNDANMNDNEKVNLKLDIFKKTIDFINSNNLNYWIHIISLDDIKEISNDSKFELFDLFALLEPLYDKGILEIFKLTSVHKTLVLQNFSKYVVAYVLAGSQVKGRSIESSDVDVYVVIDDTDVRLHTFEELKAKLHLAIGSDALKAKLLVKANKVLHPQVYTLTEFWKAMSESSPVIITFLRDGIALYDRGMFISWKQLLMKGIIKPSKEASDKYLTSAEEAIREAENKIKDTITNLIVEDIAVGLITAGQALIMRLGYLPTDPKETPELLKKLFVDERKLLNDKDIEIIKEIWKMRKDWEHGVKKEYSYDDLKQALEKANIVIKDIKSVINVVDKEVELRDIEYFIEEFNKAKKEYLDLFGDLNKLNEDEKTILNEIEESIKNYREGKMELLNLDNFIEKLKIITRVLNGYSQERILELSTIYKYNIISNDKNYEVYLTDNRIYIIDNNNGKIYGYDYNGNKIEEKDIKLKEELFTEISKNPKGFIDLNTIEAFKKIFGTFSITKGL